MDLQGSLPIFVVLGVAGFLLGNMFAAKPKAHEVRTADFRLLARKFGFNPKIIARPAWLPAKVQNSSNHPTKGDFVAVYSLVCDDWRLPLAQFIAADGVWQKAALADELLQQQAKKVDFLDQTPIVLPKDMADNAIGLQLKANSIVFYWQDTAYQKSQGRHKLDDVQAKNDLQQLKDTLSFWANGKHTA